MDYRPWRGRSAAYLARGEEPMDWAEMMRRFRGATSGVVLPMSQEEVQQVEQDAHALLRWPHPSVPHQKRGPCTHVRPERVLRVAVEKALGLPDGFAVAHLMVRAGQPAITAFIYGPPEPLQRFLADRAADGRPVFATPSIMKKATHA